MRRGAGGAGVSLLIETPGLSLFELFFSIRVDLAATVQEKRSRERVLYTRDGFGGGAVRGLLDFLSELGPGGWILGRPGDRPHRTVRDRSDLPTCRELRE